jgi:hypothetical protein
VVTYPIPIQASFTFDSPEHTSNPSTERIGETPREPRTEKSSTSTIVVVPWDDLNLDREFFHQIHQWTKLNPETKLDVLISEASSLVDQGRPLLQALPDGILPFRGFVEAMAQLFVLGAVVPREGSSLEKWER